MNHKQILTYLFLFFAYISWGQYSEDLSKVRPTVDFNEKEFQLKKDSVVTIEHHDNAKVEEALEGYAEFVNKIECARGYRIQIYLGRSESEVEEVKKKLKEIEGFEKAEVYVEYRVDFRVKVGDYVERLRAHQDLIKLQKVFDKALLLPENCIPIAKVK